MEIINTDFQTLKPYWRNPRNNDKTIPHLIESITKFGFQVPIVVDENNIIVTGHSRYKAVGEMVGTLDKVIAKLKKKAGKEGLIESLELINKGQIPTVIAKGLTDEQIREFRITDNKVAELSEWNEEYLKTELKTLQGTIGFSAEELNNLIGINTAEFENLTAEDMGKATAEMGEHFENLAKGNEFLDITCPHCAEQFQISKAELRKVAK